MSGKHRKFEAPRWSLADAAGCPRSGCACRLLPLVQAAALDPGDAVAFEDGGGRIVRGTVQVVDRYPAASGMQPTFDAMGEDGVLYKHCPLSSIVEAG